MIRLVASQDQWKKLRVAAALNGMSVPLLIIRYALEGATQIIAADTRQEEK